MTLLTYDDPTAYEGLEKRKPRDPIAVECPKCNGHGGWILRRDAYGPGRHFRASCDNCWGWGYVKPGSKDANCLHEYQTDRNVGRCLNVWKCRKCGAEREVDSSD
jgi:hypothetical protein